MKALKHAALILIVAAVWGHASTANLRSDLQRIADQSWYGARAADDSQARGRSGEGWDTAGLKGSTLVSPPLVSVPVKGTQETPTADLFIGDPDKGNIKEPPNPLTKDNKLKTQKSGKRLWWAAGGALAGAGLGFLLGGPVGAAIGGVLGAVAGFFFGP
ncbi:MAG: hypothetical protein ABIJ96_10820 [Elusimicrobiota bacterium]